MKRYTFFTDDYPVVTCDHCYEDQNENYCGPAIERLAEYEATGLMPAEVAALQYQLRHAMGGQRWIPVTERLPNICETVLVCFDFMGAKAFRVSDRYGKNGMLWAGLPSNSEVTHWMPMPEPPKEET